MNDIETPSTNFNAGGEPASRNSRTKHDFVKVITATWAKTAEAVIETCCYVFDAKQQLLRDEFNTMLASELPFDGSVGRKLYRIGRNEILIRAPGHKLPPAWTILWELAKTPDKILRAALADGRVHPKMSRKVAIALREPKEEEQEQEEKVARGNTGAESAPDEKIDTTVASVAAVFNTLQSAAVVEFLDALSPAHRAALAEYFKQPKAPTANPKIGELIHLCKGLLAHPLQHVEEIRGKLNEIARLSGCEPAKLRSPRKESQQETQAKLNYGAFPRAMGIGAAGQAGNKI